MDPLVAHQRAQDAFAALLANVSPDQLGASTPCSEWTINDLIEHVIDRNEYVGQRAGRNQEAPVRPDDTVAAHRAAAEAAQHVFAGPDGMAAMFKGALRGSPRSDLHRDADHRRADPRVGSRRSHW